MKRLFILSAMIATPLVALAAVGELPGISAHRLWLFAHLLLFVFWLGADLGVFLCSRAAAQPGLSIEQRRRTMELARSIDLAPRISASLMLSVGGVLTEYVGIGHAWWQWAGIILLGPAWLALVVIGFIRDGTPLGRTVAWLDDAFRAVLVLAVPLSVAWSWSTGRLDTAPYVAGKLLIFAALMALGLLLRRRWRAFDAALDRAACRAGGDAEISVAQQRTQPLVVSIWLGLALATLLGVSKPGAVEKATVDGVAVTAVTAAGQLRQL